jgi:hypothetical protein
MSGKVGRPHVPGSERRRKYAAALGISMPMAMRLKERELDQLDKCKDDSFRRVLLGVRSA